MDAATFFAATVYMTLARFIIALDATEYAMMAPQRINRIYVTIDVICFLSQFAGAGVQASGNVDVISIGNKVILGRLIFQLVAFGFFIFMALRIQTRLNKETKLYRSDAATAWVSARKYFRALYVVGVCFMLRNIVRAVEYGQIANGGGFPFATRNEDGSLHYSTERKSRISDNEVWLYVFDGAMMIGITVVFLVLHPGRLIKTERQKTKEAVLLEMERRESQS